MALLAWNSNCRWRLRSSSVVGPGFQSGDIGTSNGGCVETEAVMPWRDVRAADSDGRIRATAQDGGAECGAGVAEAFANL